MKLYNTLTRSKEEFDIKDKKVRMYVCGPTVYNYIHIGNARCFVVFDMLRRYLEKLGNEVVFVQNFTDVDDKMINRAKAEGCTVPEIAERYIAEYRKDAEGLGVRPATFHPRATENIDEIIGIVSDLIARGTPMFPAATCISPPKAFLITAACHIITSTSWRPACA